MAGIVEAVTKELEPEDPFEDLVAELWLKHCLRLRLDRICVIFSADGVSVKP